MRLLVFCLLGMGFIYSCQQENTASETHAIMSTEGASNYEEPHRPQFHFTPAANWMNDPNGMVFYKGEYHLFYQYYPDSTVWGPMHWGHAVSKDMVHWSHLPIALYPDSLGYIFSGSAVIDWNNTSGLGKDGPPMIAIFTHHDIKGEKAGENQFQYQSIAYSNDRGRSWTKYAGNPVVPNPGIKDFRDPKVIWHEASQKWIMVFAAYDKAMFYHSPDLIHWTYASEFGIPGDTRLWECPDLFPMKVEGSDETKWILITSIQKEAPNGGTATSYFIGDFDGEIFRGNNKDQHWLDYGRDNYALVSWSDIPARDGRRLVLGWMSNWEYAQVVPTEKWRSAMTLARTLSLKNTPEGLRLTSRPVKELQGLRGAEVLIPVEGAGEEMALEDQIPFSLQSLELQVDWLLPETEEAEVGIEWSNGQGEFYRFGYDGKTQLFYSDRRKSGKIDFSEAFAKKIHLAPRFTKDRRLKLHFFMDAASVEIFTDDGQVVMTEILFPSQPYHQLKTFNTGTKATLKKAQAYELKSIW